jgi:SAM-dependent methyltransferase
MISCPLTGSTNVTLLKKIESRRIAQLYDMFNIETRDVFQDVPHIYKYYSLDTGYGFYYPFSIQGKASLYENLEKNEWYYKEQKWEHIRSMELINHADKILEIGCGEGSFLSSLKNKYYNEPVGLELNSHAVEKATKKGLTVHKEDLSIFSKRNHECFNVVCFFQVLEHIADPLSFLQNAVHVLKPGGRLILAVPNNESLLNKDYENALNFPPHHMGLWTEKSLRFLSSCLRVKVELIEKEPLQKEHIDWYVRVLLKRILGKRIYYHIISKTFILRLLRRRIELRASQIHGHSIMAVYKK